MLCEPEHETFSKINITAVETPPDEIEAYKVLQKCLEQRERYIFREEVAPWRSVAAAAIDEVTLGGAGTGDGDASAMTYPLARCGLPHPVGCPLCDQADEMMYMILEVIKLVLLCRSWECKCATMTVRSPSQQCMTSLMSCTLYKSHNSLQRFKVMAKVIFSAILEQLPKSVPGTSCPGKPIPY